MKRIIIISIALTMGLLSCNKKNAVKQTPEDGIKLLQASAFADTLNGKPISLYTLKSGKGLIAQVTNYGCAVASLWVPDKAGQYADIVIGYDSIKKYINNPDGRFLNTVVGRYANRIAKGKCKIDGKEYSFPLNNNGQTLHGGYKGFDTQVWNVEKVTENSIELSYTSLDGEEGFPGNVRTKVTYTLTPENEFVIKYSATTDKPTVVNLSFHSLFNLKGFGGGTITDHLLTINADKITPVDSVLIPTGKFDIVDGTPFDFRKPTAIGERIGVDNQQLKNGSGYDHNWVLNRKSDKDVELVASLYEPVSGRFLEVWTDQPGLQFYSGNFFDGKQNGKYGKLMKYREGLALETQKFPDSPNQSAFPNTLLNPGETYSQTCIYKFYTK